MKPSIPKGTRDLIPRHVFRQNYIFSVIRQVFEQYGYLPIETPALENLDTLLGKYGDEGDKLLFKILNNGDFLGKADKHALENLDSKSLLPSIARRGLRYDLTVPFARFVAMNQHQLQFPFKRYQIQPVWRADRPQKGRYQEFYQCDADAVGSDSLMYEAEYIAIIDKVFTKLGMEVEIRINHRLILNAIAELCGVSDRLAEMTVGIDKLSKIGWDGVKREWTKSEYSQVQIEGLTRFFSTKNRKDLFALLDGSESGRKAASELTEIFGYLEGLSFTQDVIYDPTLARGLSYYTGCIFEVVSKEVKIGSILGGGRYADLTGVFGLKGMSGVGISFGVARIFDVMEELNKWPEHIDHSPRALLIALDQEAHKKAFGILREIHDAGTSAQLYPEPTKLRKQLKYANASGVNYVIIIGEEEIEKQKYTLKDMKTGEQSNIPLEEIILRIKK